jgi:hypothetical protein
MTDSATQRAEYIIDEAQMILAASGRVRLFFPGGPVDPVSIEYGPTRHFVMLEVAPGSFAKVLTLSFAGWQELMEPGDADQP